jgi:hypothetical protein
MTFRVETTITGMTGAPYLSVMHFRSSDVADTPDAAVAAVGDFWGDLPSILANDMSYTVSGEVPEFDPATGTASAFWSVTPVTGVFSEAGEKIPFAAQGLLRWGTGGVVNGRQVKGPRSSPASPWAALTRAAYSPRRRRRSQLRATPCLARRTRSWSSGRGRSRALRTPRTTAPAPSIWPRPRVCGTNSPSCVGVETDRGRFGLPRSAERLPSLGGVREAFSRSEQVRGEAFRPEAIGDAYGARFLVRGGFRF